MRRSWLALVLPALASCFSEPSYEGKSCSAASACPAGLTCYDGQCRLFIEPDGGEGDASALAIPDAAERPDSKTTVEAPREIDPVDETPVDAGFADAAAAPLDAAEDRVDAAPAMPADTGVAIDAAVEPPRPETCNGLDDDRDTVIDEDCPAGPVGFMNPYESPLTGWLPFGDDWSNNGCAPDQVLVGFFGHYDQYLNQVGEHCSTPRIVEHRDTTPYRYTLELFDGPSAVPRGGAMGESYDFRCPAGMIVVAISGRSGSWIDQLSFTCAAFTLVERSDAGARIFSIEEVAGSRTLVPANAGGAGGGPFDLPCPTSSAAAIRLRGAIGSITCCPAVITTLGVGCRELSVPVR